jgi:hypothetical protein
MHHRILVSLCLLALLAQLCTPVLGKQATPSPNDDVGIKYIPAGSKVFITPLEGGFEIYLAASLVKKQVPVLIVNDRSKADFEITGISESEKAGWAKMLFMGSQQSAEQASIKVVNLKTDVIAFAYTVNKGNSVRGKQSAAEACAKHLKEKIEKRL